MNPTRLIALWYEPGTAADAAAAANKGRPDHEHVSPAWPRAQWALAQKDGRLPPQAFVRPTDGWSPNQADILKAFMGVKRERAA